MCSQEEKKEEIKEEKNQLFKIRHSLAHVLAAAVLQRYPQTKVTIGPVVENGFYYDMDFGEEKVSDKDLKVFQKNMKKIIGQKFDLVLSEITKEKALEKWSDNEYKKELIEEISANGEKITTYKIQKEKQDGQMKVVFEDLCEGPHIANTEEINLKAFKLSKVAGAYWRGDEKNKMLTRVYGLAFETPEELANYEHMIKEAEKRDHRKLGKELELFTFSPLVGAGLPLWTPKGTILRTEIDRYVQELRSEYGYQRVTIPHITKPDLYKVSGHYDKFADELFKIKTREGKEYFMKPMNCPHHTQIFNAFPKTYKDMPQRYSETTMVYRDEQSGELGGLSRVLSITQDDSHIFCRESQIKEEVSGVWDIIDKFYGMFGFDLKVRLSFHDPEHMEKYLGSKEVWENSENAIKEIAEERNWEYTVGIGEATLYGPKLDFMGKDSLGREHQVATIQLDRNLPERFKLSFVNEEGEKERPVMLHVAIAGSLERFSSIMIEHTAGNFPFRFSPVQAKIIPVGDFANDYAKNVFEELKKDFRIELDDSNNGFGKKVRVAKKEKLPYFIVIGEKDIEAKKVTLENRDSGDSSQVSLEELINIFEEENK